MLSKSFITALEPIAQADVLRKVREVVKGGEGKVWIDEKEGKFQYPYTFVLHSRSFSTFADARS